MTKEGTERGFRRHIFIQRCIGEPYPPENLSLTITLTINTFQRDKTFKPEGPYFKPGAKQHQELRKLNCYFKTFTLLSFSRLAPTLLKKQWRLLPWACHPLGAILKVRCGQAHCYLKEAQSDNNVGLHNADDTVIGLLHVTLKTRPGLMRRPSTTPSNQSSGASTNHFNCNIGAILSHISHL